MKVKLTQDGWVCSLGIIVEKQENKFYIHNIEENYMKY